MTDQVQPANTPEIRRRSIRLCASDFVASSRVDRDVHNYDYGESSSSRPTSRPFGHGSIPCLSPILEGSRGSQPHLSWQMAVSIQATLARNPKIGTRHIASSQNAQMATTPSQCSGARVEAVLLYQYWRLCIVLPSLLMVKCSVSIYCVNQGARPLLQAFYAAIKKSPAAVFPVRFYADPSLASGIISGRMDGFFSFPLDKPFVIDTGAALLNDEAESIK